MIEVSEATKIINDSVLNLSKIKVPLEKALGRVLRQEVFADTDFPPFDRVMMDGIAIKYEDFATGIKTYNISGIQAAGSSKMTLKSSGFCIEIMTGAVAPENADVVIRYEDVVVNQEKGIATIRVNDIKKYNNIHKRGTDKKAGDLLISAGSLIGSPEIAVAASVGLTELSVTKNPSIAIVSTGNELVDIHEVPEFHQIRRSNVYAISAELKQLGIKSEIYHFKDDESKLTTELETLLKTHDIMILSGGVSKGKFDFVPGVLERLGVKKMFHRISQKPGKPFWFGVKEEENIVFAFPGNPVSTFLCYHKYFAPWIKMALGLQPSNVRKAILADDINIKTSLTYFLQVSTSMSDDGRIMAMPNVGRGSGDHANLLTSDAFLELPGEKSEYKKGEVYNLISFRRL